jgi:hypothetical protein
VTFMVETIACLIYFRKVDRLLYCMISLSGCMLYCYLVSTLCVVQHCSVGLTTRVTTEHVVSREGSEGSKRFNPQPLPRINHPGSQ